MGVRRLAFRTGLVLPTVLLLLVIPTTLGSSASGSSGPASIHPGSNPYACPFVTTEFASARNVRLAAATFSLAVGDSLTATFEFQVVNATTTPIRLHLTVPSFFATFPLANGTTLSYYYPPRSITILNQSWTNASLATKTKVMTAPTTFSGANFDMSSQIIAIMGDAAYQTVTLAFRWDYSVTFASNGTTVTSPWSRVVTTGAHPNTFYPAPTDQLASTSNRTVVIGTNFSAYLTGAISQTTFHSVLEYAATGNVIRNTPTFTPVGNSSPDRVSVLILPTSGPIAPTTLLDHVRNVCGALLFSISVKAIYAASANVTMRILPSTCGPITLNGSVYSDGAKPVLTPSSTALSLSVGACPGHTFLGWNSSGGAWVTSSKSSSTTASISASGAILARFA